MKLLAWAERYVNRVGGSPGYAEQLRYMSARLDWDVETVTTEQVDSYLTRALGKLSPNTVRNHATMLQTLLKAAKRDGLNTCISFPFRRVKPARRPIRAWSLDDMRRLIETARRSKRRFRDVDHATFLEAWFLVAFSTGLRAGDLRALRRDQIVGNKISVVQQKTQEPITCFLNPESLAAIGRLPRKARVFGDFAGKKSIERAVNLCVRETGLEGSTKWLRRSSATYAELMGISAQLQLGHRTPGLAFKHYVSPDLINENRPPMPSILAKPKGRKRVH